MKCFKICHILEKENPKQFFLPTTFWFWIFRIYLVSLCCRLKCAKIICMILATYGEFQFEKKFDLKCNMCACIKTWKRYSIGYWVKSELDLWRNISAINNGYTNTSKTKIEFFPRLKLYFLLNFAHYGLKAAVFSLIFDLDEINLLWYLNCIDYRYFYLPNLNTITCI